MHSRSARHSRMGQSSRAIVALAAIAVVMAACSSTAPSAPASRAPAATAPGTASTTASVAPASAAPASAAATASRAPSVPASSVATSAPATSASVAPSALPTATASAPGSPPASSPASSPDHHRGGTLSVGFNGDIQYLDPALAFDVISTPASRLVFEGLVSYDRSGTIVPVLAAEMPSVTADGKTYTFALRQGAKFVKQDGTVLREVSADDVLYSLNRLLDPNLKPTPSPGAAAFFSNIVGAPDVLAGKAKTAAGIKRIDAAHVSISLTTPDQTFLSTMATPFASILAKEFAGLDGTKIAETAVGTGPFLLKSYTRGQKAVFVRNPFYWDPAKPYLDTIEFRVGIDSQTLVQQVKADELDIIGDPFPVATLEETRADPTYKDRMYSAVLGATSYLSMDTTLKGSPLEKVEVRRAMNYAIDKEHISTLLHGTLTPTNCIFPPRMPGYRKDCSPYTYDPAKAKQMLADAGYPNGFETTIYTDTSDDSKTIAAAEQQDLAQIGVKAEVVTQSFDVLLTTITTPGKAPMVGIGWSQDYPDPSDFIDPILSCATAVAGGSNVAHYCDPETDKMAADARIEPDQAKRLAAYQAIEARILDAAPWIPIANNTQWTLVSSHVATFYQHPVWILDLAEYSAKP